MASPSTANGLVDPFRLVRLAEEKVHNVSSPFFPHHQPASSSGASRAIARQQQQSQLLNGAWDLDAFRRDLVIKITRMSSERVEFDLIGVDASIANAIRRVLIAEVPTVAIENVYIFKNSSIIQDEVLSHRLGLVPIKIDPDMMQMKSTGDTPDDMNTLVFVLNVECTRNPAYHIGRKNKGAVVSAATQETDPEKLYENPNVLSGMLDWVPQGNQQEWNFATANNPSADKPRPVHDRILLAKLRPGQGVEAEVHCEKGIGKDHAKFSPVATASYRLLPHIDILAPIEGEQAQADFIRCFPPGVIGRRPKKGGAKGEMEVYVQDPRKDTVSREVLRHEQFKDKIQLGRIRDYFLFDIESTGIIPPERLLLSSLKVLTDKIQTLQQALDIMENPRD
ncbi:putative Rpc40-40 kd subunit of DNA-directed RNA polymerases I and III [Tilletiaria anomala UBC 951]|uniref:DNA-directed RNA polymerases I and III subunit RPAC1 n=1 Tax=Tilletiaria anomala (strain ATCC 24038 / CBS 436.72 / UBC 951) TaxID=1037660 RepID=A0A066VCP9_TILAU|nr:putative Rpc40-40 kd subunit of DNA-directed RNA polymerases I and III [Tilletiaria anomala UBC 951]KDN36549.1 putative Rpc40-40 kd subunit of DNA-directed RNA polymerases I and III [Tilletiaria anomala UBC 951]